MSQLLLLLKRLEDEFAGFPKSLVFEKLILMKENKRLLIIEVKNILTNV